MFVILALGRQSKRTIEFKFSRLGSSRRKEEENGRKRKERRRRKEGNKKDMKEGR